MELDIYSPDLIKNETPITEKIKDLRKKIYEDSIKYRDKSNLHLFAFKMIDYIMGIALILNAISVFFFQNTVTGKIISVSLFGIKMLYVFDFQKHWHSSKEMSNKLKKLLGKLDRALIHTEEEIKLDYYLQIRDKLIDLEYDMYQSFSYL